MSMASADELAVNRAVSRKASDAESLLLCASTSDQRLAWLKLIKSRLTRDQLTTREALTERYLESRIDIQSILGHDIHDIRSQVSRVSQDIFGAPDAIAPISDAAGSPHAATCSASGDSPSTCSGGAGSGRGAMRGGTGLSSTTSCDATTAAGSQTAPRRLPTSETATTAQLIQTDASCSRRSSNSGRVATIAGSSDSGLHANTSATLSFVSDGPVPTPNPHQGLEQGMGAGHFAFRREEAGSSCESDAGVGTSATGASDGEADRPDETKQSSRGPPTTPPHRAMMRLAEARSSEKLPAGLRPRRRSVGE